MSVDAFDCPHCQLKLRRSPAMTSGVPVQCPRCKNIFTVPPLPGPEVEELPVVEMTEPPPPPKPSRPAPRQEATAPAARKKPAAPSPPPKAPARKKPAAPAPAREEPPAEESDPFAFDSEPAGRAGGSQTSGGRRARAEAGGFDFDFEKEAISLPEGVAQINARQTLQGVNTVFRGGLMIYLAVLLTALVQIGALLTLPLSSPVGLDMWCEYFLGSYTTSAFPDPTRTPVNLATYTRYLGTMAILLGAAFGIVGLLRCRRGVPGTPFLPLVASACVIFSVALAVAMPVAVFVLHEVAYEWLHLGVFEEGVWKVRVGKVLLGPAYFFALLGVGCFLLFLRKVAQAFEDQQLARAPLWLFAPLAVGSVLILAADLACGVAIQAVVRDVFLQKFLIQLTTLLFFGCWTVLTVASLAWLTRIKSRLGRLLQKAMRAQGRAETRAEAEEDEPPARPARRRRD